MAQEKNAYVPTDTNMFHVILLNQANQRLGEQITTLFGTFLETRKL